MNRAVHRQRLSSKRRAPLGVLSLLGVLALIGSACAATPASPAPAGTAAGTAASASLGASASPLGSASASISASATGAASATASAPTGTASATGATASASTGATSGTKPKVFGAFATQIEEPWDGVIHRALEAEKQAGRIEYDFTDDIGYAGDMERVLQEIAEREQPDVIFGDAFGNEEAVRRVAAKYPDIAFVFGSGGGASEPNLSVFDNWIHEPAYLAGMLAGGLTKSGTIGVVGGFPVPEVNRITNAFIAGAREVNPKVQAKVTFINSWFDPAAAKEAALAQAGAGADVVYAERFGVIEAAQEKGLLAVGNMSDQRELAPQRVVTSVTWNMAPTVKYVIDQVMAGSYTAQDLKDFSMMGKGGAAIAPINSAVQGGIPADLMQKVQAKEQQIKNGTFRVDIQEGTPPGSVVPKS